MPEKTQKTEAKPKKKGKCILIVEDEHPLAHALELKFRHEGFETIVVGNGKDALAHANDEAVCIILLDLIMPNMDGFTFLEELKTLKHQSKVIVLTNLGQEEDEKRVRTYENVVEYFVKSNTPITDIVQKVKSALAS